MLCFPSTRDSDIEIEGERERELAKERDIERKRERDRERVRARLPQPPSNSWISKQRTVQGCLAYKKTPTPLGPP